MTVDERLQRLLGGAELAALRQRLRRHFERLNDGKAGPTLQLDRLSPGEHAALAQLTGRPSRPSRSARIDIATIDAALRAAGIADSLCDGLERLDGPITSRAAVQAAHTAAWSAVTAMPGRHPMLQVWLLAPQAGALLKRLTRQDTGSAAALLARADAVLQALPARGMPRAQLAAQVLGNAHALDAGQPVASVLLAVWRQHEPAADTEDDGDPERSRDTWARAGVLVNELARPALVLNLPGVGAPGEPTYLSLRQLLRAPPAWPLAGSTVFVCENPNLLAIAADQLGAHCAPLVCTDGMPAAAQRTLLGQLARAGAQLRCHADFDWPGIRIANHVQRSCGARAWRMAAEDYAVAAQTAPHAERDLGDGAVTASWDAGLAPAMQLAGFAIAEEAVAQGLLEDLRRG